MQWIGWALIFYPHVPDGFSYSPGLDPSRYNNGAEALYISAVTLTTLGYGDVIAAHPVIRFLSPLEALTGFALLTAAVSWFMQIYPALGRRRALAVRLALLQHADYGSRLDDLDPSSVTNTVEALISELAQVRVDLTQTSESYYFWESNKELSLPATVSYAVCLAERTQRSAEPTIRVAGGLLQDALESLGDFCVKSFLKRAVRQKMFSGHTPTTMGIPTAQTTDMLPRERLKH